VVKEDEANEQHKSIIQVEALKAAALEWTFEQIDFVARRRGAVVEDDFYNKRERLNVQAGKRDKTLVAHVQGICEVHDTAMQSYYQQIHTCIRIHTHMYIYTLAHIHIYTHTYIYIQSYYQQIHGSSGADATTSMENIGEQVYV